MMGSIFNLIEKCDSTLVFQGPYKTIILSGPPLGYRHMCTFSITISIGVYFKTHLVGVCVYKGMCVCEREAPEGFQWT